MLFPFQIVVHFFWILILSAAKDLLFIDGAHDPDSSYERRAPMTETLEARLLQLGKVGSSLSSSRVLDTASARPGAGP